MQIVGLGVLGVAGGCVVGALTARSAALGIVCALALLLLAVVVRRPVTLAVIALVGAYIGQRLGGSSATPGLGGGVSYSDALLAAAAFISLPAVLGTPEGRRLRVAMYGLSVYLACLLPTVILNQSTRADFEWVHRLSLVGGSLLVGAWIVREQLTRTALRWLVGASCLAALFALENTARHGFSAASPFGWNKNFIGALFAAVIVVAAAANSQMKLSPRVQATAVVLLASGLLASQSRGGMLAAVFGMLIAYTLDSRAHSRRARALSILVALVLAAFAYTSIRDQLNQSHQDLNNSSIGVRFNVERVTRDIWRTSPGAGVGLKYFVTGSYGPFAQAPNNVVDNELAESGLVGLVGFVVLQGSLLAVGFRRRRQNKLVAVGVGVVAGLLLHGQVDIYWIAGSASLPFMIMGMALALGPADGSDRRPDRDEPLAQRSLSPSPV
ncbi:MAG: hypothetical protein QOI42_1939 [Frankiaceae bacterium]|nr:hypothetical protein [Frankiaceae bacterium]